MNLLTAPWIPVLRRSGDRDEIAPWQIADVVDSNAVVRLASPRADLDGGLAQLLIGWLQAAIPPENEREWERRLSNPPPPEELRDAFQPLVPFFDLLGDGPRFLQDLELDESEGKVVEIEKLLIDHGLSAGAIFVRTGEIPCLCHPCTAMALMTLQSSAPSGGRGHRTSLRGGGPLTTLVAPFSPDAPLWERLWWNVLEPERVGRPHPDVAHGADHRFP